MHIANANMMHVELYIVEDVVGRQQCSGVKNNKVTKQLDGVI